MKGLTVRPPESELDAPNLKTLIRLVVDGFLAPLRDPRGIVIATTLVGLCLWGFHGNLELLGKIWDGWTGPGSDVAGRARIMPGVPWDQEWISFWAGALFVVGLPALVIKFVFKRGLSDFGLGMPAKGRGKLAAISAGALFVLAFASFYQYGHGADMSAVYPFYRDFDNVGQFVIYEIGYLPFFVAIEFIFRGFLLFGMYVLPARSGEDAPNLTSLRPDWRLLLPILAYTAWHLGKPLPELWGTLVWGPAAGAIVLATRSIWPIVLVHWLLNVWMDLVSWQGW